MSPEHEDCVEYAVRAGAEMTGISLEQLGYSPRPEDLSAAERNGLETWDLDWVETVTPEPRDKSPFQARLLACALWALDGFEGALELNMQLGLAPMEFRDWFEAFNESCVPAFVH